MGDIRFDRSKTTDQSQGWSPPPIFEPAKDDQCENMAHVLFLKCQTAHFLNNRVPKFTARVAGRSPSNTTNKEYIKKTPGIQAVHGLRQFNLCLQCNLNLAVKWDTNS
eukprot:Gregarina_sp_Poly_1__4680@NODE_249_length_10714_cov_159_244576_g218_i0_p8_GENE_NODE_249_length_10714_cov_159_244576_g218_i0NODE_249_length_10714_cov_159_244576_g218_i0_p8_ORF_typecomplete_len108_score5_50_NODE_249_length_10714_cov_159_244576_g218_i0446769